MPELNASHRVFDPRMSGMSGLSISEVRGVGCQPDRAPDQTGSSVPESVDEKAGRRASRDSLDQAQASAFEQRGEAPRIVLPVAVAKTPDQRAVAARNDDERVTADL